MRAVQSWRRGGNEMFLGRGLKVRARAGDVRGTGARGREEEADEDMEEGGRRR